MEDILRNNKDKAFYEAMKAEMYRRASAARRPVTWFPQYRQWVMLNRTEEEGFYGGAAGGGKTDYLVIEALSQVHIPNYRGIIFRKTYPELREIIDKSYVYYKTAFPKAKYNDSKHVWTFPSGAKIYFGSLQYEKDKHKYQGMQFDFIGFDELTHFTLGEYEYLRSRNRAAGAGTTVYMRSTGNPGGIGHGWVKSTFVTAGKPEEPVEEVLNIQKPDGSMMQIARRKIFIPSKVFDNEMLLANNPGYLANLSLLNEQDRAALMDGNWDIFSGQVFTEFRNNPDGYKSHVMSHVIDPFLIPDYWTVFRGFDYGYSKPFSVGWYAADTDGTIYRINGLYGCRRNKNGDPVPDTGVKWEPTEIARKIREIEHTDVNLRGKNIVGVADPAIFEESGGSCVADMMAKEGVYFNKADHTRLAGKMQCHYRLKFDKQGKAKFYVFDVYGNRDFIRTIPSLVYDENNVEDVDTKQEDHIYDEWRYVMMERIMTPEPEKPAEMHEFDPLNMYEEDY